MGGDWLEEGERQDNTWQVLRDSSSASSLRQTSVHSAGANLVHTMGSSWKQRVLGVLLCTAAVLGLIMLILILVDVTNVLLPADTKWPADKENDTGVVSQAMDCRVNGSGISSYASNPAQAGESLQDCLQEALALIPKARHKETPLFLGATAGMRLLNQKNSSQADSIFAAVSHTLHQSPADFRGAELLTGENEGAFGWITINYVLGALVKYSFSGEWIRPPKATLVGALDMGGASTQITFVPQGPILDKSTEATFRLYGFNYSVYTHSYLCFGRDQMLNRLLVGLVQSSPGSMIRHPCYLSGYRDTVSLASLYDSSCIDTKPPPNLPQNLAVEGAGNPEACISIIQNLFNFSSCQGREDCAFGGVYQPPVHGQFYAFANFYYTFSFLNLTYKQSLPEANTTIWKFCQRSWEEVVVSYPGQQPWLRDYCASGLYILTLLTEGYGFTQETWASIEFHKQVSGTDIGWTLGYMLNLTNLIPSQAPTQGKAQTQALWVAGVVFVVLTFVAILGAAAVQLLWPQD
ncbi:ectonucleoside triphosphate diphosphohydrolase 8 isoform X2 [Erinaceus europaeus]|uniref:Ectonucleoside triphosphate diphosphohydrolase 8 n=1 Tax=Erinaceus europaeus TaxID=9365 RepID=A0A1S3WVH1_ERIEU|nr:ectonucleoside triphosphate diphosphohydrolase 8 isoform X2 [Erinaceus europaeus]